MVDSTTFSFLRRILKTSSASSEEMISRIPTAFTLEVGMRTFMPLSRMRST